MASNYLVLICISGKIKTYSRAEMFLKEFLPLESRISGCPFEMSVGVGMEQAVGWVGCSVDGIPPFLCWNGFYGSEVAFL